MATVLESGDISNDETVKKLGEMMTEYLTFKKIERESNFSKLHPSIRRRIDALKKLQIDANQMDVAFHKKMLELEAEFQGKYEEVVKKRFAIVKGEVEPNNEDLYNQNEFKEVTVDEVGPIGIPFFWLTVLKNISELNSLIQDYDEPILKHLIDIRSVCKVEPELLFTLEFYFAPNEYFKNDCLTKTYHMKCELDGDDPFGFDGPEIYKADGCKIDWNDGKDVTKIDQETETNTFFPNSDSFFTFFNPPSVPAYDVPGYDKIEEYLENDFEIGHFIKERVIPRAVMFYLGEYEDIMSSGGTTAEVPINSHTYFESETEETEEIAKNEESDAEPIAEDS